LSREYRLWSPSKGVIQTEGLSFDKEAHKYYFRGTELSGITGSIGKKLKKNFPEGIVEEHRGQGNHVHDAIETWIKLGVVKSVHPSVTWAIETLRERRSTNMSHLFSEVVVSDFKRYASCVDILEYFTEKECDIYDTKAGAFSRPYVSLQLGVYKYFLEEFMDIKVRNCWCLATKDKEVYPIFPAERSKVISLLKTGGK